MAAATFASWLQISGWEEEKEPALKDFDMILFFALFFLVARFFLDRIILERLGKRFVIGSTKHLSEAELEQRQKKHIKFKESGWKWIHYLSGELFALAVTYNEPWFTDTKKFWIGPGDQDEAEDFVHVHGFARVGSVVLSLHDASDVFLDLGKMGKYSGSNLLASLAFIMFAVSWVVLRLIYFPFWVIWSTSYQVLQTLDKENHEEEGPVLYYVFNSLLICLLVLHLYWWGLILRMLIKQVRAREKLGENVRSDSEGDDKDD